MAQIPKSAVPSSKRKALIQRVGVELGRELGTTSIFLHQAIAGKLGLNVTDTRCFELMSRYSQPPLTAGDLARATGLTTGAVTGILDRLENARLVERFRDPSDRRKVFVRPRPEALQRMGRLYKGLAAASLKLASSYSTKELKLIRDYLEGTLQIVRDHRQVHLNNKVVRKRDQKSHYRTLPSTDKLLIRL